MTKKIIIIATLLALGYLYYSQNRKLQQLSDAASDLIFNPSTSEPKNFDLKDNKK